MELLQKITNNKSKKIVSTKIKIKSKIKIRIRIRMIMRMRQKVVTIITDK